MGFIFVALSSEKFLFQKKKPNYDKSVLKLSTFRFLDTCCNLAGSLCVFTKRVQTEMF